MHHQIEHNSKLLAHKFSCKKIKNITNNCIYVDNLCTHRKVPVNMKWNNEKKFFKINATKKKQQKKSQSKGKWKILTLKNNSYWTCEH